MYYTCTILTAKKNAFIESIAKPINSKSRSRLREEKKYRETSAQYRLQQRKETVDMNKVGEDRVDFSKLGLDQTETNCLKSIKIYAIAQAIEDKISFNESGLVIRPISPYMDLQPSYIQNPMPDWEIPIIGYYNCVNCIYDVYNGFHNGDLKVVVIMGFQNLDPDYKCYAQEIYFARGYIKTIEVINTAKLRYGTGRYTISTPVLYKRGDAFRMMVRPGQGAIGKKDIIQTVGVVVESIGRNMTG